MKVKPKMIEPSAKIVEQQTAFVRFFAIKKRLMKNNNTRSSATTNKFCGPIVRMSFVCPKNVAIDLIAPSPKPHTLSIKPRKFIAAVKSAETAKIGKRIEKSGTTRG